MQNKSLSLTKLLGSLAVALFLFCAAPMAVAQDSLATMAESPIALAADTADLGLAEQVNQDNTGFEGKILKWYDAHINYTTEALLMTVESSFIPFPSEVVIPPAVFVAANPDSEGGMKIWLIVLAGTIGAMLGAYINYFLSRWLGRPIIYAFVESKLGHLFMLSGEKMEKAEKYFNDHGVVSTFVGRLIPVIRQLISIPAGLAKMNLVTFSIFTFLGAGLWNVILALIGYYAYKIGQLSIIQEYSHTIGIIFVVLVCAVLAFYIVRTIVRKRKKNTTK